MSKTTDQLRFAGKAGSSTCEICHRRLSNPESRKRGLGPVCAARVARQMTESEQAEGEVSQEE